MRSSFLKVFCFLFLSYLSSFSALVITEVMSNSDHPGGAANGDWWELTNTGEIEISLENYVWNDENNFSSGQSIFPDITIQGGESILIVDEISENINYFISSWGGDFRAFSKSVFLGEETFSSLNAPGDSIYLFDLNSTLITSVEFGLSSNGFSFEWSKSGENLGLSELGVNGAFRASANGAGGVGTDIASPGIAIPEANTAVFLFLSLGFLLNRRFRFA